MSAQALLSKINAGLARIGIGAALSMVPAGASVPVAPVELTNLARALNLHTPVPEGYMIVAQGGSGPLGPLGADLQLASATIEAGQTLVVETARLPDGAVVNWGDTTSGGTDHVYTTPGTYSVRVEAGGQVLRSTIRTLTVLAAGSQPDWFNAPFQGPLVITAGGEYTGNHRSTDPNVPAVDIRTTEHVILRNMRLESAGHCVDGHRTQAWLTMRNVHGLALNPNDPTKTNGRFVNLENFVSADVEGCEAGRTSGMYFHTWKGAADQPMPTVNVQKNKLTDLDGRYSDGSGGYQTTFYRIQFVQFNDVKQIPRVKIMYNHVVNAPYVSHVEDTINLYSSSGAENSWIEIAWNLLDGAYHNVPGSRYSGGGIVVGDGDGGENVHVHHNAVVQSSNYSIANAGARRNVTFEDNREASTGMLPDGTLINTNNDAGYYNRNYPQVLNWQPDTVIWRRNSAAHGRPTSSDPARRGDYSLNAPALATVSDNTSVNGGSGAVTDADVQAVRDWMLGLWSAAGITPGLAA